MAENVAETWEELEDSDLDKKLNTLVLHSSDVSEETEECKRECVAGVMPQLLEESSGRTAYQPSVRILKRDRAADATSPANHVQLPSKPVRTLQEREVAYAEARLRILGSAVSSDEDVVNNSCDDRLGPSKNTEAVNSSSESSTSNVNVMRQPRGPDGSKGFTLTR